MSRSYRKPWLVARRKNKKYYKRLASKTLRRVLKDSEIINIPYKKYFDSYSISDYRKYLPNNIKFYKK